MDNVYITVIGAWGDALAALGNASLLQRANIQEYKVIYFGFDRNIKTFLKWQPGVQSVIHVPPKNWEHYEKVCLLACCTENVNHTHWLPLLDLKIDGIVIQTHITDYLQRENPEYCVRDFECVLERSFPKFRKPTLLFQPYSVQSSTFQEHWPHWMEALDWILEETEWDVVVAGARYVYSPVGESNFVFPELPEHERLTVMVGKTQSMTDVFALADACQGIVTTNNCLSMWSVITDKPALVVHTKREYPYFHNWIDYGRNKVLPFGTSLEEFKRCILQTLQPSLPSHI